MRDRATRKRSAKWFFICYWFSIILVAIYFPTIFRFVVGKTSSLPMIQLHLRTNLIYEGQPVDDLLAKHGPFNIESFGPYQTFLPPGEYVGLFEGHQLTAKNGRLCAATTWGCTQGLKVYFNTLTPGEWKEFGELQRAEWKRRNQARLDTQIAASSSVLYESIYSIPQPNVVRVARMAAAGIGSYKQPIQSVETRLRIEARMAVAGVGAYPEPVTPVEE
jgi:hypothetical protein